MPVPPTPVPPHPELAPEVLAAVLDAARAVAVHGGGGAGRVRGASVWWVGESALAARLGLAQARVTLALHAADAEAAHAAFLHAREVLRRTPNRPRWCGVDERGAAEAELCVLELTGDPFEFAHALRAAGHAPLVLACDVHSGAWIDPHDVLGALAARRLPAFDAHVLARLRAHGLASWTGFELAPHDERAAKGEERASSAMARQTPRDALVRPEPLEHPQRREVVAELRAWAQRRGATAALRALGPADARLCRLASADDEAWNVRLDVLRALEEASGGGPGLLGALCVLFDPLRGELEAPDAWQDARARLDACGADGALRSAALRAWRLGAVLEALQCRAAHVGFEGLRQSERIRVVREPEWPLVARLACAWARRLSTSAHELRELEELVRALHDFRAEFDPHELAPHPLLAIGDMINARIPRGAQTRELLDEALDLQLDGVLATREAAVSWLRARSLELALGDRAQLGGKMRRKKKASG